MNKRILLFVPAIALLTGCFKLPIGKKSSSSEQTSVSYSEITKTSDENTSSEETSSYEESFLEESSELESSETSSGSEQEEGNWPKEIADAMDEYIGERLPYAPLDADSITYDYYSYPDSGFYYLSIYDDNKINVLENYGLLLLDCGYTEEYTVYKKISSRGQELQIVFGYIEPDEDEDYEAGNEIDIYIYDDVEEESSSSSSETSSEETSHPEPAEIITKTYDFTNTSISNGAHLDDASQMETFVNYLNGNDSYITDVVASKCDFKTIPHNDNNKTVLCVGTASSEGSITFTFSYQIQQISLVLQGYHKYIESSSSYSMDANSKLYINDESHLYELGSKDTNPPEKVTANITFDELTNQITLYNLDATQRAYVYSMEVTMVVF